MAGVLNDWCIIDVIVDISINTLTMLTSITFYYVASSPDKPNVGRRSFVYKSDTVQMFYKNVDCQSCHVILSMSGAPTLVYPNTFAFDFIIAPDSKIVLLCT